MDTCSNASQVGDGNPNPLCAFVGLDGGDVRFGFSRCAISSVLIASFCFVSF
jgi:hypothetical protein